MKSVRLTQQCCTSMLQPTTQLSWLRMYCQPRCSTAPDTHSHNTTTATLNTLPLQLPATPRQAPTVLLAAAAAVVEARGCVLLAKLPPSSNDCSASSSNCPAASRVPLQVPVNHMNCRVCSARGTIRPLASTSSSTTWPEMVGRSSYGLRAAFTCVYNANTGDMSIGVLVSGHANRQCIRVALLLTSAAVLQQYTYVCANKPSTACHSQHSPAAVGPVRSAAVWPTRLASLPSVAAATCQTARRALQL